MKRIIISLMAIVLVIALVGAGTFAYFFDTETSTANTFTAGTLDLKLNDGVLDSWADGASATWSSPTNWAPGDEVDATLRLKNVGSTNTTWLGFDLKNLTAGGGINNVEPESEPAGGGNNNLASQIIVTHFQATELDISGNELWTTGNYIGWLATRASFIIGAPDGIMTLEEFVDGTYGPMIWAAEGGTNYPEGEGQLLLANSGSEVRVKMKFLFNPNAGNDYQGDQASFDLGTVTFNGPPANYWGASRYGYGSLE